MDNIPLREGTHPYTPLKGGFSLSPWWERVRVRGKKVFMENLLLSVIPLAPFKKGNYYDLKGG